MAKLFDSIQVIGLTTAERDAITFAEGSLIYNETTKEFQQFNGSIWEALNGSGGGGASFGDIWAANTLINC